MNDLYAQTVFHKTVSKKTAPRSTGIAGFSSGKCDSDYIYYVKIISGVFVAVEEEGILVLWW